MIDHRSNLTRKGMRSAAAWLSRHVSFGLRTLLIFVTLFAIAFAWIGYRYQCGVREYEIAAQLNRLDLVSVRYHVRGAIFGDPVPFQVWDAANLFVAIARPVNIGIHQRPMDKECMELVSQLRDVKSLSIDECDGVDNMVAAIFNLPHLEDLVIRQCAISDESVRALSTFPRLRSLGLEGSDISEEAIIKLISEMPRLTEADLDATAASDKCLSDLVRVCPDIEQLWLGGTKISDHGMKCLPQLRSLSLIDLADTAVSDDCISVLERCEMLSDVFLSGTAISSDGVARLRATFAQAHIHE